MKITDSQSFVNLDAYTRNINEKGNIHSSDQNKEKRSLKGDSVQLSSGANKILEAKKLMGSVPDVRDQKVADIKNQIENGTYQFRTKETAFRLLRDSLLSDLMVS